MIKRLATRFKFLGVSAGIGEHHLYGCTLPNEAGIVLLIAGAIVNVAVRPVPEVCVSGWRERRLHECGEPVVSRSVNMP